YRLLAVRDGKTARLLSRNGNDLSDRFPEVTRALGAMPFDRFILDGEVVALDDAGRPSFQRLQQRGRISRSIDIRRATVENPVTFYAFDLLAFGDHDVRPLPLTQRKAVLPKLLPPAGVLRYLEHFERDGEAVFEQVRTLGLEGMMAKRADSPYRAGRSPNWLKIRIRHTGDFVVVGFSAPKGSRGGFGALFLGQYVDGVLTYTGRAGSGFTGPQLAEVRAQLDALKRTSPPFRGPVPTDKGTVWVEPRLVVEVEYTEWTDEGLLRQPVFLRFRDDKRPEDCVGQGNPGQRPDAGPDPEVPGGEKSSRGDMPQERVVNFTNLDKVFWPEEGYTKGDLIEYYRVVSAWMLPYLRDRPVVLTRYPDGITGKSFFQKDAPGFVPDWIRTERMWSEQAER
ncbi:MAG: non-homologous end-joining DNA ligase, partial [Gemmatimonadales bacterium]